MKTISCEKNELERLNPSRAGRPTKYDPSYREKVTELMREGASIKEVAYALNIARGTLYKWIDKNKELAEVINDGVEDAEAWWMMHGRKNIYNKDFNSTLWYMNMKNRFGWKDKVDNNHIINVRHEDALKELE